MVWVAVTLSSVVADICGDWGRHVHQEFLVEMNLQWKLKRQPQPLRRIITTHDPSGRANFSDAVSEHVSFTAFPVPSPPANLDRTVLWPTTQAPFPVQGLSPPTSATPESKSNLDIKQYRSQLANPSPLNPPNGTTCTIVEVPPGSEVPMH